MTRQLTWIAAGLFLLACGRDPAADYRDASPSRQGIKIELPKGGQALTSQEGVSQQALLGQTADLYKVTVAVTYVLNGGVGAVLNLVEEIVKWDPTTVSEDTAVWGPHTDPLSPMTFKFTVKRNGNAFDYVLEGKPKASDDSTYKALLAGSHEPTSKLVGKGRFAIDQDAIGVLEGNANKVGKIGVEYERNTRMDVGIVMAFHQVRDEETGQRIDAGYAFAQVAGGDGAFEFVVLKDLQNSGSSKERMAIMSRWHQDGAGRGDVQASGGDLGGAKITVSECWNSSFARVFYQDSLGIAPTEGAASACVFADAQYSQM